MSKNLSRLPGYESLLAKADHCLVAKVREIQDDAIIWHYDFDKYFDDTSCFYSSPEMSRPVPLIGRLYVDNPAERAEASRVAVDRLEQSRRVHRVATSLVKQIMRQAAKELIEIPPEGLNVTTEQFETLVELGYDEVCRDYIDK